MSLIANSPMLNMPVLPLRDVVVFPHMVIPLFVGRKQSIEALQVVLESKEKKIFLVAQKKDSKKENDIVASNLYKVGTIANILQAVKLPDGSLKVLVEGVTRAKVVKYNSDLGFLDAQIKLTNEIYPKNCDFEPLTRTLLTQFEQYVKLNKKVLPDVILSLAEVKEPSHLIDIIASHVNLKVEARQKVLEICNVKKRIDALMLLIEAEIDLLRVEKKIRGRVKGQIEKNQREYYLNEQMRAIKKELSQKKDSYDEMADLKRKVKKAKMPKEAHDKVSRELEKLEHMPSMAAEATVSRNYIDAMLDVPWVKKSKIKGDLAQAQLILDKDHYGLEKIKERILEYLAVQQRVQKIRGPILCLVGPAGVGKTSLGASIARSIGRKFVRASLGGVRDEAEIRGHRRTYIGSMPGKIIKKLSKVGVKNPLFLLDEIDKMTMDYHGDPSAALLEVLDPEQNNTFNDHYLEVDYDLSDVMFVATANTMDIPEPLLDRMEVIRIAGYTEDEKLNIAKQYLIPKQLKAAGLRKQEIKFTDGGLLDIIRYYTHEAGVRGLDREIAKVCRKVVKSILLSKSTKALKIDGKNLKDYLGVRKYRFGLADSANQIGQVTGLAWTEVGGELLKIETTIVPGKGNTQCTGTLGEVMKESIQAAVSVVRSRSDALGLDEDFYQNIDIHVHVPEGATPKDGPSAGGAVCTALVSALTRRPVRADLAMTGEITLRGEILPIGGLKEKLLAARRGGIKQVLIPKENEKDLAEIPQNIKKTLTITPVQWVDDVLKIALEADLTKKSGKNATKKAKSTKKSKK